MNFTKMHGLGNDFIIIDNTNNQINLTSNAIKNLAHRQFGIGFDQLLIVEKSILEKVDFKYRIFNADGREVEQCGNGARCFARFVVIKKLTNNNPIIVETNTGVISLLIKNTNVIVNMGKADFTTTTILKNPQQQKIYNISNYEMGLISMGNPHAILIVKDINNKIKTNALKIQQSNEFINSINVGFMQIIDYNNIKLRVYERGSGETLACGSGACAAVSFGIKQGLLGKKVKVKLLGGSCIIEKTQNGILLTGPAEFVFEGNIEI